MKRPRVYGSETKFRAVVARHITSGEELLEQSVGARSLIDALPKQDELSAFLIDAGWGRQFRRWFGTAQRAIGKYLQDQFETVLPILFRGLPPDTGKPRHQVGIDNGEPWLRETLRQLKELQDALGVRRDVATAAPAPAGFEELHASGLVDEKVIADHEKAMRSPRTPKQLAEAIGSAKELTEATPGGAQPA